VFLKRKLSFSR